MHILLSAVPPEKETLNKPIHVNPSEPKQIQTDSTELEILSDVLKQENLIKHNKETNAQDFRLDRGINNEEKDNPISSAQTIKSIIKNNQEKDNAKISQNIKKA